MSRHSKRNREEEVFAGYFREVWLTLDYLETKNGNAL